MYKIDYGKYFKFLDWDVIFCGIKNDIIGVESAIDYANELVRKNILENDSLCIDLFILEEMSKSGVLTLISNEIPCCEKEESVCIRILRYIILDSIKNSKREDKDLLNEIENIYADFDYPEDMNSLIGYMPVENKEYNSSAHTQEENEHRLIELFYDFLKFELEWIQQVKF